jgi:hypothetical protein
MGVALAYSRNPIEIKKLVEKAKSVAAMVKTGRA